MASWWQLAKEKFHETSTEDLVLGFMDVSLGMCMLFGALAILTATIRYAITGH